MNVVRANRQAVIASIVFIARPVNKIHESKAFSVFMFAQINVFKIFMIMMSLSLGAHTSY